MAHVSKTPYFLIDSIDAESCHHYCDHFGNIARSISQLFVFKANGHLYDVRLFTMIKRNP